MSELKTNKISTNDQNNVAIDNALGLKSYTTTQRDALTSVPGDTIYNSTTGTIDYYNGSAWFSSSSNTFSVTIQSLVIAGGGGAGGDAGGGGGAGGYRNSYASETSGRNSSTETPLLISKGTNATVTVGAGGPVTGTFTPANGNNSIFSTITSIGGGHGGGGGTNSSAGDNGGSGGGGYEYNDASGGTGTAGQGFDADRGRDEGGGGGGAGEAGGTDANGAGGDGLASSITGSSVTRAGGGGGGKSVSRAGNEGVGGAGGGGNGGSGVVILRWLTTSATIGATRTGLTDGGVQTSGSDSYIVFTAGTGTIIFS